jgi:pimeloyl-ACP methyl ester carboxylesterase
MTDPLFSTRLVGEGPEKIIAVHGWMGDHRLYDPLADFIDGARLTFAFPDCRGYGTRADVAGAMTVEEIAADVRALAADLGWDRYHVLGHSMAGMAAQRLLLDAPEVASAMLLAPVPASGARIDDERRALLTAALTDPDQRLALIDANTGGVRSREWLRALRDLSVSGTRPEPMRAYMASWTGQGFAADLVDRVLAPVSVLIGALDPGSPEARVRDVYATLLPHARINVLHDTGHYAMREEPKQLVEAIERHLAAV